MMSYYELIMKEPFIQRHVPYLYNLFPAKVLAQNKCVNICWFCQISWVPNPFWKGSISTFSIDIMYLRLEKIKIGVNFELSLVSLLKIRFCLWKQCEINMSNLQERSSNWKSVFSDYWILIIRVLKIQIKLLTPNLISARNSTLSLLNKYQSFIVFFLLVKFIFHTCVFQKCIVLVCVPKRYKLNHCFCI